MIWSPNCIPYAVREGIELPTSPTQSFNIYSRPTNGATVCTSFQLEIIGSSVARFPVHPIFISSCAQALSFYSDGSISILVKRQSLSGYEPRKTVYYYVDRLHFPSSHSTHVYALCILPELRCPALFSSSLCHYSASSSLVAIRSAVATSIGCGCQAFIIRCPRAWTGRQLGWALCAILLQ